MEDDRGRPRRDPARRFGPSAGRPQPRDVPPRAASGPAPGSSPSARLRRGDLREMRPAAAGIGRPPSSVSLRESPTRDVGAPPPPPRPRTAPGGPPRPGGPSRPAPPAADGPRRAPWRLLRIVVTVVSVLVLAVSGTAWAALSGSFASSGALSKKGTAADGATDVLLVGTDSRNDAQGNPLPRDVLAQLDAGSADGELNTDSMILVRVPNDGSRAVAFSLPRDSYVGLPWSSGKGKLNSVYPGAKAAMAEQLVSGGDSDPRDVDVRSSEAGRAALIETVQELTGIGVDHYAEINLLGFFNLTNAIGGVDVCLKNAVDDDFSGAHFAAGPRSVAGHDALAFVRQRHGLPMGDLDRVRRQQAFLAGLSHKVLSAGTLADPVTLSRLLDSVKQSVVLDGGWDLLGFAQQMQGVSGGAVTFMTIPTQGGVSTNAGDALKIDEYEVRQFVTDAIGPKDTPVVPTGPAPATIPVDVRNASGTGGAAARVVQILGAQGYTQLRSGNADELASSSAIAFGPGGDAGAGVVARALGGLPTRPDASLPPNSVQVLLAPDYAGPGAVTTPSDAADSAPPPPPQPPITADGIACVN
ncbi:LCP family protein [Actinomycetospora termitidis]|uniref:LCP family protein n=1 Tax=Actinomycetospora termitidis TaxID=3053470 RepID=A0ABT7M952_9PSEU|nr:LCP family protein [Actinomycetospora sp. Odt1-22]MDL5157208.1 LCP family protein [Actinomycetospora sp. Odt1-22]